MAAYRTVTLSMLAAGSLMLATHSCNYKPRNQGRVLYERECQGCHMEMGQGLGQLMPPVANADYVKQNPDKLACIIRNGMSGEVVVNGVTYSGEMPGNSQLTEVEITNLIYYILEVLNEQKDTMTLVDIQRQLEACRQP